MKGSRFIDSNIWLHALFEPKQDEIDKHKRAVGLLNDVQSTWISGQVIAVVSCNLIRSKICSEHELLNYIDSFYLRCHVVSPNKALHHVASQLRQRYSFSFWDSLIVAAALESDCETLYSEDMQPGLRIASLTLVNPLKP